MHNSVREFVEECVELINKPDINRRWHLNDILEIGSRNVNGTVRDFFLDAHDYVGIDIVNGFDVDTIMDSHQMTFSDDDFDIILCLEMLEHDNCPWLTLAEIDRVLCPGGYLILTTRAFDEKGCYPMHDDPHGDYWRFTVAGIHWMLTYFLFQVIICKPDPDETGVFVLARQV